MTNPKPGSTTNESHSTGWTEGEHCFRGPSLTQVLGGTWRWTWEGGVHSSWKCLGIGCAVCWSFMWVLATWVCSVCDTLLSWHSVNLAVCVLKTNFKKCIWSLTLLFFISLSLLPHIYLSLSRESLHKPNFYQSQEVTELLSMHLVISESWRFLFLPLPVVRSE